MKNEKGKMKKMQVQICLLLIQVKMFQAPFAVFKFSELGFFHFTFFIFHSSFTQSANA
jgi:hypothetical protein